MSGVGNSFYFDNDNIAHRVSSVSYSQDGGSASTFCSREFEIDSEDELMYVPLKLVDRTEICAECERSHSYISYERFNSEPEDIDYKFFIRASLKLGDKKGMIISETVGADSLEGAKSKIEDAYSMAEVLQYIYIVRSREYTDWEVITDERMYKP
jgi:hypothetical protein